MITAFCQSILLFMSNMREHHLRMKNFSNSAIFLEVTHLLFFIYIPIFVYLVYFFVISGLAPFNRISSPAE